MLPKSRFDPTFSVQYNIVQEYVPLHPETAKPRVDVFVLVINGQPIDTWQSSRLGDNQVTIWHTAKIILSRVK